jgi:hypothetical protein
LFENIYKNANELQNIKAEEQDQKSFPSDSAPGAGPNSYREARLPITPPTLGRDLELVVVPPPRFRHLEIVLIF